MAQEGNQWLSPGRIKHIYIHLEIVQHDWYERYMEVDPKNVKPRENTSLNEEVDTDIGKLTYKSWFAILFGGGG